MKDDVIRVSFSKDEEQLLSDILEECKYIGKAKWMKIAAREKLKRDKEASTMTLNTSNQNNNVSNTIPIEQKPNNKLPIINELSDLFKG